jgi:hypothetical protein
MRTEFRLAPALGGLPARAFHLPGKLLHVMAHFVGDHVGLGKIARGPETRLQIAEERKVEVELLVVGTVERAHRRLPHAAGRAHASVVEDERRRVIGNLGLLEDLGPDVLGAAENLGDELSRLVRGRALGRFARFALRAHLLRHIDYRARVETEKVGNEGNHDSAHAQTTSDADSASVLDITAGPLVT